MKLITIVAVFGATACLAISYTGHLGVMYAVWILSTLLMLALAGVHNHQRYHRKQPQRQNAMPVAKLPDGHTMIHGQSGNATTTSRHVLPSGTIVEIVTTTTGNGNATTTLHERQPTVNNKTIVLPNVWSNDGVKLVERSNAIEVI